MQQEGRLTAIAIAATACTVESPGELSKVVVPAVHGDLCEQDADCDIDSLASQLIKDLRVAHGPGNAEPPENPSDRKTDVRTENLPARSALYGGAWKLNNRVFSVHSLTLGQPPEILINAHPLSAVWVDIRDPPRLALKLYEYHPVRCHSDPSQNRLRQRTREYSLDTTEHAP